MSPGGPPRSKRANTAILEAAFRLPGEKGFAANSVKHVNAISVRIGAPRRYGKAIEHPRARVALEERHARISGRPLRRVYRALIIPTALMAQRSAKGRS